MIDTLTTARSNLAASRRIEAQQAFASTKLQALSIANQPPSRIISLFH